jgi:hypothetical protein
MAPLTTAHSTLVLDRPDCEPESASNDVKTAEAPSRAPLEERTVIDLRRRQPGFSSDLPRLGLAALAVVFSYEGYKWLGVLPLGDSRWSSIVFGRPGTVLIAVLAMVASLPFARRISRVRFLTEGPLLASALAVVAAACVEVAGVGPAAVVTLGVTDLVFAAAAFGFFILTEFRNRQSEASCSARLRAIR